VPAGAEALAVAGVGEAAGRLGEAGGADVLGRALGLGRERAGGPALALAVGRTELAAGAMLTTGTAGSGLVVVFRTTRPAPNQARPTAAAVPPSHAARPASTRDMSAIMPHARPIVRTVRVLARVLIVEDDPLVRSAMVADLTQRAHAVRTAGTALDGIREVSQHPPEIIVLDLGLPDLDGGSALKMMRAVTTTPVIVATARDEEAEIIRLLNDGADDYLVKPFSGEHLGARIAALLRRAGPASAATVIRAGGLLIDLARRQVLLDGTPLDLSRREFDLLAYLAARPGVVVSRPELLAEVWRQAYGEDQTIDVHVSWLRRKLGETAARPRYLRTVRGVGVMLDPPA
jgi:DNA-binding response OmpR family regulator